MKFSRIDKKIALFLVLGLILAGGLVFAGYKLGEIQTKRQAERERSKLIKLTRCDKDGDCVLAIKLDVCCSCPEVVFHEVLREDKNLVEYEFGKDYSKEVKVDCRGVECTPCALWNKAICDGGKCKAVFEEVSVDCRKLETLEMEDLTQILKADCQNCGERWELLSMDLGKTGCNPKTSDAGKACTDSEQCIGVCLGRENVLSSGTCSDYKFVLGCNLEFSGGEQVVICRD